MPTSAADWATFTPAERQAAYDWVYINVIQSSKAEPTIVATAQAVPASPGIKPMAATARLAVSGRCGFSVQNYPMGSTVAGWSDVSTSQDVPWLDTGVTGWPSYVDQLWRNGAKSYTTYAGKAEARYVYASTSWDWKWSWESVHYVFQAWDSVEFPEGYWYWYLAYCVVSYDA